MQCSIWGLTRAECRGRITSLDLLAAVFLMHPRRPLAFLATRAHWWLMISLSSTILLAKAVMIICHETTLNVVFTS